MIESEKYLGNFILYKWNKCLCFDILISKIKRLIQSWQVISSREEHLDKTCGFFYACLQYVSSDSSNKMMRNFLWGDGVDKKKVPYHQME